MDKEKEKIFKIKDQYAKKAELAAIRGVLQTIGGAALLLAGGTMCCRGKTLTKTIGFGSLLVGGLLISIGSVMFGSYVGVDYLGDDFLEPVKKGPDLKIVKTGKKVND